MGLSFKLAKKGARWQPTPKSVVAEEANGLVEELGSFESSNGRAGAGSNREPASAEVTNGATCALVSSTFSVGLELPGLEEYDVSFTLNLFQKGYLIGNPTETENIQPLLQDGKSLHPYDRASESMFSAIESGRLPGDILDDIPSKFINGTLVCEVRDYRKCLPEQGSSGTDGPAVKKIRLRMSLENVVKDIPLLADDSWTYSDLMEVEARIVKAMQPKLYLDPTPNMDRLCADPCPNKLNLGIGRKRPWQTPEVIVTSNSQTHGKKVCIDEVSENDNFKPGESGTVLGNVAIQGIPENTAAQLVSSGIPSTRSNNFAQENARPALPLQSSNKFQPAVNFPGIVHDHGAGSSASFAGASANISSPQSLMGSYTDTVNSNVALLGKRENQDAQIATQQGLKRLKQTQGGLDGIQQQQQLNSQFIGVNAQDINWKNPLIRSQLDASGSQYTTVGQRYPSHAMNNVSNQESGTGFYSNQQVMRYVPKEEQTDAEKLDTKDALQAMTRENNALDQQLSRPQHLGQQPSVRNHLPPLTQWHNSRPLVDKDMRKDDMFQKRKTLTSPRVSSGPMVQSPVSSKSGEISSGSVGQFSAVAATSALGSQKATANSNAVVGAPSATSSPNDSVHRQPQAKRKSNSATKTQAISGVGSPASVSNMNAPLNASSPSIGTVPMGDQVERFAKIDMVTQRYQLNVKKTKIDEFPAKKVVGLPTQHFSVLLNDSYNADDFIDEMKPVSRSLVGGNINICKARTIEFMRTESNQAIKRRLILLEKPFDGTVNMQYGDADASKAPSSRDCMLTLPTTNHADLLAAQFCILIGKEGYQKGDDQVQTLSNHLGSAAPSVLTMVQGVPSDDAAPEIKQEMTTGLSNISGQHHNTNIGMGSPNLSQNLSSSPRMLASGSNSLALPMSQGYFPGAGMPPRAQLDQPLLQHQQQIQQQQQQQQQQHMQPQQQQQHPLSQIPRSSSMLSQNPLSQLMGQNSNLQMNANTMMANKSAAHLQLQIMQQQQQQHQQQQNPMQRKVMMGLNAAMGGMGNTNMVGLGGLGNIMGMGGLRPMSGLSGMRPNQMTNQMNLSSMSNFGTGIRPGSLSADQAAAMAQKLKQVHQNRMAGVYGGQAGMVGGIPSSAGLSMLGHAMNRSNMSQLQRSALAPMGPPKIPNPNFYHQHQQLQLQQQHNQQQLQQQQQLQLQQQQQQQISSPLQQSQVSSPLMQQQQQISQQTTMSPQLSSGALQQQMNNNVGGNAGGGAPASPQLSSQTHGSVGSITSSPMEQLQGANKGGNI